MKKRYIIEEFRQAELVKLYTIKFDDEEQNEFNRFTSRFTKDNKHKDDFNIITYWVDKITQTGALERHFRPEKEAVAIPIESGYNLRLYCYRINDKILILGNGGIKTSRKVQDSPDCFPHFELMNHVAKEVHCALCDKKLSYSNGKLNGKLEFNYKT